jgi:hypothetical protein
MAEQEQQFELDYTPETEYLNALCNVVDLMDKVDAMTKPAQKRKERILDKSLDVIDKIVSGIHDSYFQADE